MIIDRILTGIMAGSLVGALVVVGVLAYRAGDDPRPGTLDAQAVGTPVVSWQQYVARGYSLGADDVSTIMVVFADFQCPACRHFSTVLDSIHARYPRRLRIVLRHFPLEYMHLYAKAAAVAAECARRQDRFIEYYRALYEDQADIGHRSWMAYAAHAGVRDTTRFNACMNDTAVVAAVEADIAAGRLLGINSTPTFLLNGMLYRRAYPLTPLDRLGACPSNGPGQPGMVRRCGAR